MKSKLSIEPAIITSRPAKMSKNEVKIPKGFKAIPGSD